MFAIFQAYNENKQMQKRHARSKYDVQNEGYQIKTMLQMWLKILFLL